MVEDANTLGQDPRAWTFVEDMIVAKRGKRQGGGTYEQVYRASVPEGTGNPHQFASWYGVRQPTTADLNDTVPQEAGRSGKR